MFQQCVSSLLGPVIAGACVALVVSAVLLLLGGYGGYLRQVRVVNALIDETERIEGRIEREIKTRAALSKRNDPTVDRIIEGGLFKGGDLPLRDRRADILRRSKGG